MSGPDDLRGLLRRWRSLRGMSQLDLALQADISQRHLSFIERGRSRPSRDVLLALAAALDVPLRERNALLVAADFAPTYAEPAWDAVQMSSIRNAVERMLRAQEPYPAVLMDRSWNVLAANDASPQFFGRFFDLHAYQKRTGRRNLVHLMFDPFAMRPFLANWPAAARSLLQRVRRESAGHVIDERTRALLSALHAYPDVPSEATGADSDADGMLPMVPLAFERDGAVLNYFSMVTTVGAPETISAEELRIESLFPADEETETRHQALMRA